MQKRRAENHLQNIETNHNQEIQVQSKLLTDMKYLTFTSCSLTLNCRKYSRKDDSTFEPLSEEVFTEEFDFESNNARFNKKQVFAEMVIF